MDAQDRLARARPGMVPGVLLATFMLLLAQPAAGLEVLVGRVVAITGGASFILQDASQKQRHIRIAAVDVPASRRGGGDRPKTSLNALIFNHFVTVEFAMPAGTTRRIAGRVLIAPAASACRYRENCQRTQDVGLEQVRRGMARYDRRHQGLLPPALQMEYQQAEFLAKTRRMGLWAN